MLNNFWFWAFVIAAICCLMQLFPMIVRTVFAVPVPDNGSWGYISLNPYFTRTTIEVMAEMGDKPLCTADSRTNLGLHRFLFADGRLFNSEDNKLFIEALGGAKAFFARVSKSPKWDAERLAVMYTEEGYTARVVEHYDAEMKGKMYFVSFRDSKYNPGWVPAFRLHGSKLGRTKRWQGREQLIK